MREIKFRAWHDEGKEWVDDIVLDTRGNYYIRYRCEFEGDNRRLILCQYTGLKDKNGKEIYEGDTIRCHLRKPDPFNAGQILLEVVFSDAWLAFGVTDGGAFWEFHKLDDVEVRGNIYENPELLGGK